MMVENKRKKKKGTKVPHWYKHSLTVTNRSRNTSYINFLVRGEESALVAYWYKQLSNKQWPSQASGFDTRNGESPGQGAYKPILITKQKIAT